MPTSPEYFVVDELTRRAQRVVDRFPGFWKRDGRIEPALLIWPADAVKLTNGEYHDNLIVTRLPPDRDKWPNLFLSALELTQPYGVLLIEQAIDRVLAILETHLGTRTWSIPIVRHGDVRVLGRADIATNRESLGLLWRPGSATA